MPERSWFHFYETSCHPCSCCIVDRIWSILLWRVWKNCTEMSLVCDLILSIKISCDWAGDCNRFRASQYTVTFGEYDLRSEDVGQSESFQVSEIRVHPRFTGTGFYNDVALFKLSKPVRFTQHIQPICLPSAAQRRDTFVGQVPTIIGWGTTYYGNPLISPSLWIFIGFSWDSISVLIFGIFQIFRKKKENKKRERGRERERDLYHINESPRIPRDSGELIGFTEILF